MLLKVKKINPEATTPTYGSDGAGCFDLYSCEQVVLAQDESYAFDTGLAFEIPEGYVMLIFLRSSMGARGFALNGHVGVVDSDYRGSVFVPLTMMKRSIQVINEGDRIAQAMVVPFPKVEFMEVETLTETKRGKGGFGSTGV